MEECKDLKTDSMESIGMKALGTLHHILFGDKVLLYDIMRRIGC